MKDEGREERRWPVHFFGNGRGAWGLGGGRARSPSEPQGNDVDCRRGAFGERALPDDEEDVVEVSAARTKSAPSRLGLADGLVLAFVLLLLAALILLMPALD